MKVEYNYSSVQGYSRQQTAEIEFVGKRLSKVSFSGGDVDTCHPLKSVTLFSNDETAHILSALTALSDVLREHMGTCAHLGTSGGHMMKREIAAISLIDGLAAIGFIVVDYKK